MHPPIYRSMGFYYGFWAALPRIFFGALLAPFVGGCVVFDGQTVLQKSPEPELPAITQPLSAAQRGALLDEVGRNWLYGQGIGDTVLSIGAVVAFPPYLIAIVANGALSFAGYEPISISAAMPDELREQYVTGREAVLSAPGQVAAAAANEEFRTQRMAKEAIRSAMLTADEEVRYR